MRFLQLAKEQRYSVRKFKPQPWHVKRFDMEHTVFYNSFDGITEGEAH